MSKKSGGVVALVGMCALSLFLLNCGSSSNRQAGQLYVISQAENENNITSYAIDLNNGNLSQINLTETTCKTLAQTPPVTCGLPVSMLFDPTGATAFALNQGQLASPVSSSIAPTIYSYTVNSDGSLASPTIPATLPVGDTSLTMTENAAGTLLFVLDVGPTLTPTDCPSTPNNGPDCPSIQVFNATPGSTTLTPASVLRLSRIPTSLSVLTFTPPNGGTTQTLLFMTSSKDLSANNNDNELSVFSVDSSGTLTETLNSPYTTVPAPGVVLAVNTNAPPQTTGGVFVYIGAQGSGSGTVTQFQVCTVVGGEGNDGNNCTASEVASEQLIPVGTPNAVGKNPLAMLADPTNSFLYVASNGSNQIFAFQIATATGVLSQLTPASEPSQGQGPAALVLRSAVNSNYAFLYVSNYGSNTIGGFTPSTVTGVLNANPSTTLFTPGEPSAMAVR